MPYQFLYIFHLITQLCVFFSFGQSEKYSLRIIGFYNVENLFDTIDDSETIDEAYTPSGKNHYSYQDYLGKIRNTAKVISELGMNAEKKGPDLIGLAEIENFGVLNDLVDQEQLVQENYQIIHKDSPDRRGIDVALLYKNSSYSPIEFEFIELKLWNEKGERIYTRDILYAKGILDDQVIHIFVNHWPSRRGGKTRSDPKRMKAAYVVKNKVSDILMTEPDATIFILGDFNDDPTDKSIKNELLMSACSKTDCSTNFFNPMEKMHKKGMNTLAYRDGLNLFDQIIFSKNLISREKSQTSFSFLRAGIYNPSYLISQHGKYKGYPLRSFDNNRFSGGFSDHYPVFVELIRGFSQ
ncbi:MAG: endonuclease/exonuclease/phosphatase family protein [Flavobacteriales bacterium]|nr:endonuclease/exonuclease/phosphatase family protein [Flavobacteriales bacterium]